VNWFITGGCGFIGSMLTNTLLSDERNSVCVYDNHSVGDPKIFDELSLEYKISSVDNPNGLFSEKERLVVVKGDISDRKALLSSMADENPIDDCETNVMGTINVLEGCRSLGINRFVFASSGAPLGVQIPPLNEKMAPHPASPYGASKLSGEGYCSAYYHCFGIDTVALRFGNVYGEGSGNKNSVVAKFIKNALNGEDLEIYGDGSQTRDFIYLHDLIAAIKLAATKSGIGGEVFQIATSKETSIDELTELLTSVIKEETSISPKCVNRSSRIGDVSRNYSDTSKAESLLGWKAATDLRSGLTSTVKSFL